MKYLNLIAFILISFISSGQQLKLQLPIAHQTIDVRAAYSRDDKFLLTREHRTAILWDADSYRPLKEFRGVSDCEFSSDGKYIIFTKDASIDIYNIVSDKNIIAIPAGNYSSLFNPALSKDNRILYYCTTERVNGSYQPVVQIHALDITSGKSLYKKSLGTGYFSGHPLLSVSTNGQLLSINGPGGRSLVLNAATGEELYGLGTDKVMHMEFSPDDKWLLNAGTDNVSVLYAATGKVTKTIGKKSDNISHASFSYDSKKIVVSSLSGAIRIYNLNGSLVKEFHFDKPVYRSYFTSGGNFILSALEYNWIGIREVATGEVINDGFNFYAYFGGRYQATSDEKLIYSSGKLFKLSNGEEVHKFTQPMGEIETTALSSDGKYFATVTSLNNVVIWDLKTARLVADFSNPDSSKYQNHINAIVFPDSNTLVIGWNNGDVWEWDCGAGKVTGFVTGERPHIRSFIMNPRKDRILAVTDSAVTLFWPKPIKKLFTFTEEKFFIFSRSVSFSGDGTLILVNGKEKTFALDAVTGKIAGSIPNKNNAGLALISPNKKQVLLINDDRFSFLYDLKTGSELLKLQNNWGTEFHEQGAMFVGDSAVILSATTQNGSAKVWNLQKWDLVTGKLLLNIEGMGFDRVDGNEKFLLMQLGDSLVYREAANLLPRFTIEAKHFIIDTTNSRIFISDRFATHIYNYDFKKIVSLVSLGAKNEESDYQSVGGLAILPDNYYKADRNTLTELHFVSGLQVVGVNQLDMKLNRPDKVLEALNNRDTALVGAYRAAHDKRIRKAGIDQNFFVNNVALPVAEIANRGSIASEQTSQKLTLDLTAYDKEAELDHFNIWVNDVPVFGAKGQSVRKKNSKKLQERVTINLSKGMNKIEFSVTNARGIESFRKPLNVYHGSRKKAADVNVYEAYDPNKPKEKIYFIGIGIDKYKDSKQNLNWSVKDIRDLAVSIAEKNILSEVIIDTLFNENVTVANVTALKKKLMATSVDDKVIISYSGHGLLSNDLDYYLSTYSVNFQKPEEGGIAYSDFENLLDNIPARMKLVLIDACHSGEVDKEEMAKYKFMEKSLADSGTKSSRKPVLQEGAAGMQTTFALMQEMFTNVGASTGATVISAAAGTQFAQERSDLKNGVFTYSILEYMRSNSSATVTALKNYVNRRVQELTNGLQVPTTRSETRSVDWKVW